MAFSSPTRRDREQRGSMDEVGSALEGLSLENRDERLKKHCVKATEALLYHSEPLADVCWKCSDDEYVRAHKFILGTQCQCAPSSSRHLRTAGAQCIVSTSERV